MARRGSENERAPVARRARSVFVAAPWGRRDGRKLTANEAPTQVVVPTVRRNRRMCSHQRSRRLRGRGGICSGSSIGGGRELRRTLHDHVSKLLARLEPDRQPGWNLDFLLRPLGVPADSTLPVL